MESKNINSGQNKISEEVKNFVINKIFELQGISLSPREQISSLINCLQSSFDIETVAIYANFAKEQLNILSSKSGKYQFSKLGYVLDNISKQIDVQKSNYHNTLIPISELDISNLAEDELNTYIYPIVSPHAKQIYGVIILTNPKELHSAESKKLLLFVLNHITNIIEESDLSSQVVAKDHRLKLLSQLSNSLRGTLKSEKAIDIVLKEVHNFLNIENIYFIKSISSRGLIEITHEITNNNQKSMKGFIHKVSKKNPIIKLLNKNQYITYKNRNIKKISRIFLGSKEPSVFCIVPVLLRNDLLGSIVFLSHKQNLEISTEDLRITQDIAGQLAVILNQANLYEESLSTAQREFLLNSITTMIRDTLEVKEVLEKTAREIGQVFGVNACGAFLFDENSDRILNHVWTSKDIFKNRLERLPLNLENSSLMPDPITQSIAIPNIKAVDFGNTQPQINATEIKSYLACSLVKGDKTIGLLILAQFENERYWTNSEVQLLEAITDQVEMALSQADLHQHVQNTERQMNLLHEVSNAIRDSLNLSDVMARAARDLGETMHASRCFIRRLRSISPLSVVATEQEYLNENENISKASDLILDFEKEWLESLNILPDSERANSVLHIKNIDEKYKDAPNPLKTILNTIQLKSFLSIPLVTRGKIIGSLCIHQCDRYRTFTQNEIEFAKRVASEASVAVLNADLFAKVEYQAQRDSLTGLYNHAYFQTALLQEAERVKRTGANISVIMIDLDHLKSMNDKFGHKLGDEAITLVAGKLNQCLRRMDIISRYGGDEFAALLPETDLETAKQIAQRILETLNRTILSEWGTLSASIGVSGTPHEEKDKEAIMKAADDAMYVSKRSGRNKVTSSEELDALGPITKEVIKRDGDK